MRIAVLGAGFAGSTHAAAYAGMDGVQLVGIVGRSEAKVKQVADVLGTSALTNPQAVIEDPAVDAIDITYPTFLHSEYAVAALRHGKHVFCETPMALTVMEADAMLSASRESGKMLLVALLMRFVGDYAYIHEAVAGGHIGQPQVAVAARLSAPYWTERPRSMLEHGEPIVELMIHDFDYLNWLFGSPMRVAAHGWIGPSGAAEYTFVWIEYGAILAAVEGSAMMPKTYPFTTSVRIIGSEGGLESIYRFYGAGAPENKLIAYPHSGQRNVVATAGQDPYEAECRYFVECLRGRADPALLGAECGRDALRVAVAAQESLQRQGEAVDIP